MRIKWRLLHQKSLGNESRELRRLPTARKSTNALWRQQPVPVLLFSRNGWLEINLVGGLWSLCRELKFLIIVPYVLAKKPPLGIKKNLTWFKAASFKSIIKLSKSDLECVAKCHIFDRFSLFIYIYRYRATHIHCTNWFSTSISIAPSVPPPPSTSSPPQSPNPSTCSCRNVPYNCLFSVLLLQNCSRNIYFLCLNMVLVWS